MSKPPPISCVWQDDAFRPVSRHHNLARAHYGEGEVVTLVPFEERSEVSHNQQFAWLQEAWQSLPEAVAPLFPTADHLRKTALIRTGWCTTTDYVCATRAEAVRWAENLRREGDAYAVFEVAGCVVRVHRARSQKRTAMNREDFQASKTAIIDWIADLLGVSPAELGRQRAAA